MWARIAANYPVWYEPEPLALYRIHEESNSGRCVRTGETLRDVRRVLEIIEEYVPNGRGKALCQKGRELSAWKGLDTARRLLSRRDVAAATSQIRESLSLCFNFRVIVQLAFLLGWACVRAWVQTLRAKVKLEAVRFDNLENRPDKKVLQK